jgi:hypothetical protein
MATDDPFAAFLEANRSGVVDPARGRRAATAHGAPAPAEPASVYDEAQVMEALRGEPTLEQMGQQVQADEIAAAERGLEQRFGGGAPQRTLDAASQAGVSALEIAALRDKARVQVSTPNAQYPIAQKFKREMLGREGTGAVTQVPKMRQVVQPDGSMALEQETQMQQQADGSIVEVPVFEERVDTGDPGLLEQGKQAQAGVLDALQREQAAIADRQWLLNEEDKALVANQQAAMQRRQELRDQQIEASRRADKRVTAAAQALTMQPDVDPNRYTASKGAGFRISAILTGALAGFAGMDATAHLRAAIDDDIDSQKSNIGKRQQELAGALDEANIARQQYQQIFQDTQDEQLTDQIYRTAKLEAAKAELLQLQTELGVQTLSAEAQAFLADLDTQIAEQRMQISSRAAAIPEKFVRTVSTIGPNTAKALDRMSQEQIGLSGDLTKLGLTQGGAAEIEGAKAQADAAKAAASAQNEMLRGKGGIYSEAQAFARATEEAQGVDALVGEMLAQDDIAGYGATASPIPNALSPGAKTTETKLKLIKESLGRMQSGGAITEDELDTFTSLVEGGTALGGESRLRQNLGELQKMIRARISAHERALSPEARAFVRRNEGLADFDPQYTGGGSASVVDEDE